MISTLLYLSTVALSATLVMGDNLCGEVCGNKGTGQLNFEFDGNCLCHDGSKLARLRQCLDSFSNPGEHWDLVNEDSYIQIYLCIEEAEISEFGTKCQFPVRMDDRKDPTKHISFCSTPGDKIHDCGSRVSETFPFEGSLLQRVPKEYGYDHELIESCATSTMGQTNFVGTGIDGPAVSKVIEHHKANPTATHAYPGSTTSPCPSSTPTHPGAYPTGHPEPAYPSEDKEPVTPVYPSDDKKPAPPAYPTGYSEPAYPSEDKKPAPPAYPSGSPYDAYPSEDKKPVPPVYPSDDTKPAPPAYPVTPVYGDKGSKPNGPHPAYPAPEHEAKPQRPYPATPVVKPNHGGKPCPSTGCEKEPVVVKPNHGKKPCPEGGDKPIVKPSHDDAPNTYPGAYAGGSGDEDVKASKEHRYGGPLRPDQDVKPVKAKRKCKPKKKSAY